MTILILAPILHLSPLQSGEDASLDRVMLKVRAIFISVDVLSDQSYAYYLLTINLLPLFFGKICKQNRWLSSGWATPAPGGKSADAGVGSGFPKVIAAPKTFDSRQPIGPSETYGNSLWSYVFGPSEGFVRGDDEMSSRLGELWQIDPVEQLRGVNLGGLFIPEVWMNPSFFNGTMVDGKMVDRPVNDLGQALVCSWWN